MNLYFSPILTSAVSQRGTYWGSQKSGDPGASSFELSRDAERCRNFTSHNWRDDGLRKVKHLGFILVYGYLCMSAVMIALVLFAFLLVFELSLAAAFEFPLNWVRPLVPSW